LRNPAGSRIARELGLLVHELQFSLFHFLLVVLLFKNPTNFRREGLGSRSSESVQTPDQLLSRVQRAFSEKIPARAGRPEVTGKN
jgi:hypothetical protein